MVLETFEICIIFHEKINILFYQQILIETPSTSLWLHYQNGVKLEKVFR